MGNSKELILNVVDNGDSIPRTIYPRYCSDTPAAQASLGSAYEQTKISSAQRAEIVDHATKPGVTPEDRSQRDKSRVGTNIY